MNREFLVQFTAVACKCERVLAAANCLPNTPEAVEDVTQLYNDVLRPLLDTYNHVLRVLTLAELGDKDQSIVAQLIEEQYKDGSFKLRHYLVIRTLLLDKLGAIVDGITSVIRELVGENELKDKSYELRMAFTKFKRNWNLYNRYDLS
jgi:hypothetical protein